MSKHRFTIDVTVDDEALAEHDGDQKPPPNDVSEWYMTDLVEAINSGIAEVEHDSPTDYEALAEHHYQTED